MTGKVQGKVALITGAARGMGRAHAVRLAEEGAAIVGLDICGPIEGREGIPASSPEDMAETHRLVEAAGGRIVTVQGDTRSQQDLDAAVAAGLDAFGHIDIAIANAGTSGGCALAHEISEADWNTTIDINLSGVWRTAKAVLPHMLECGQGGSLVLVASAAGLRPNQHLADYGATKAGVIMMTRILALEYGGDAVRVNAVAPGNVDTPLVMNDVIFGLFRPDLDKPTANDVRPAFLGRNALKTEPWVSARDIANAVLWLCSEEASTITGTIMSVDLGMAV